ncbi:MAG: hypothetical protein RLZZ628_968 [Bacteroidota bacterium]|jgi:hypothetical protein
MTTEFEKNNNTICINKHYLHAQYRIVLNNDFGVRHTWLILWIEYESLSKKIGLNNSLKRIILDADYDEINGFPNNKDRVYNFTFQEFNRLYYDGYSFAKEHEGIYDTALMKIKEVIEREYSVDLDKNTFLKDIQIPNCKNARDKSLQLKKLFRREKLEIPELHLPPLDVHKKIFDGLLLFIFSYVFGVIFVNATTLFSQGLLALIATYLMGLWIFLIAGELTFEFTDRFFSKWIAHKVVRPKYGEYGVSTIQTFSECVVSLNPQYFKESNLTKQEAYMLTYGLFYPYKFSDRVEERFAKSCNTDFHIKLSVTEYIPEEPDYSYLDD